MQTCPRCKASVPAQLKKCVSCGTLLMAPIPQAVTQQQTEQEVSTKTIMGFPAPVQRPSAQMPQHQPVTASLQQPPRTMFGVGPAVGQQLSPQNPAPQVVEEPPPAPRTLYGVGAAAPSAPAPSAPQPPIPVQSNISQTDNTLFSDGSRSESVDNVASSNSPTNQNSPLGVVRHNTPRSTPSSAHENTPLAKGAASSTEITVLGTQPTEIDPATVLPETLKLWDRHAPGPIGSLRYFFSVVKGRLARIRAIRSLEKESKQLETLRTHTLSSLGFRALEHGFSSSQTKIVEQQTKQLITEHNKLFEEQRKVSGTLGAELQALTPKLESSSQEISEKNLALRNATKKLQQLNDERAPHTKRIEELKKKGFPADPNDLAVLEKTKIPYENAVVEQAAAQTALQTAKTYLASLEQEQKKLAKELANRQKQSSQALVEIQKQLLPYLVSIAEALLAQNSHPELASAFQADLSEIEDARVARKARIEQYQEETRAYDAQAYQQGTLFFFGGFGLIFVLLGVLGRVF